MEATHRHSDRPSRIPERSVLDEPPIEEAFRVLWRMPSDSQTAAVETNPQD